MLKSDSIAKLAPDLVRAISEMENATKNAENAAFKSGGRTSKYANLEEVLNTARPVLAKYGLALIQLPGLVMPQNPEADTYATLETVLMHSSGEWIGGTAAAPLAKTDPQGYGSALTYLRRYGAAAIVGMAQEDDDGNAASKVGAQGKKGGAPVKPVAINVSSLVASFNAATTQDQFNAVKAVAQKLPPEAQTDDLIAAYEAAQARIDATPSKED